MNLRYWELHSEYNCAVYSYLAAFNNFAEDPQKYAMQRQAWISFGFGILALLLYLVINFGVYSAFYAPLDIWSGDLRRLIGDFLLLIFYGIFFSLLTRAFVLLGMVEYFGKTRK